MRKVFSDEVKNKVVELIRVGKSWNEVSVEYGVSKSSINNWVNGKKGSKKEVDVVDDRLVRLALKEDVIKDSLIDLVMDNNEIKKKIVDMWYELNGVVV